MKKLLAISVATSSLVAICVPALQAQAAAKETLNIITWVNPPAVSIIKKINQEFEAQYPNITINFQTAASTNYNTLMQTSVQGQTADIMSIHPFEPMPYHMTSSNLSPVQNWAVHGVFMNLNNQPWVKNFSKDDLGAATYNGNIYGLVTGVYQDGVFYNKDIFKKYHLSVPTTYNQLLQVCKVLQSHHVAPFFDGLQNVGPSYLMFLNSPLVTELWASKFKGADLNSALWNNQTKWTDPGFVQALTEEKQLMQYLEPNFTGVSWQDMPGGLANGKAAMLLDGSWDLSAVYTANPHINVGYFPLPGSNNPKVNTSDLFPDLTFTVLNNSPHKDAALKWLNFFASPKIYSQYVEATGISPSFIGGHYTSIASKVMGSWFGKGMPGSVDSPSLPATGPYWLQSNNWWNMQLEIYQGKYTPQQAATMFQQGWPQVTK